jgi:hypothetical protein
MRVDGWIFGLPALCLRPARVSADGGSVNGAFRRPQPMADGCKEKPFFR